MPNRTKEELLKEISFLKKELKSHEDIQEAIHSSTRAILPHPEFHFKSRGMEIYGHTNPGHDNPWRGDYLRMLNFKEEHHLEERIDRALKKGHMDVAKNLYKYFNRVGVLLVDISGHGPGETGYLTSIDGMSRTAFQADLDVYGQITTNAIERINNVIFNYREKNSKSNNPDIEVKYASMVYIEFLLSDRKMILVNAGHHDPLIFSYGNKRFEEEIGIERFDTFSPLGLQFLDTSPDKNIYTHALGTKNKYTRQFYQFDGANDLFILYTDGVLELDNGLNVLDPKTHLEPLFIKHRNAPVNETARVLYEHIKTLGTITDDYTIILTKNV